MKPERFFAGYFGLQAAAGLILWLAIASSDTVRSGFELRAHDHAVTSSFFAADLVVVVASALTATGIVNRRPWAPLAAWFTAGGIVYPTAFLVQWVTTTSDSGSIALLVMIIVTVLCCWAAYQVGRLARTWRG